MPWLLSWIPNTWIKMFIAYFYLNSSRVTPDPTCPKLSSFSSPRNLFILFWLCYVNEPSTIHLLFSFGVIPAPASYKHPHPPNPHGFYFLLFLDSRYNSVSLVWFWLRLLSILTSLLTMLFIISLGFSCLTNRQIRWFINLFNEYVLSPTMGQVYTQRFEI